MGNKTSAPKGALPPPVATTETAAAAPPNAEPPTAVKKTSIDAYKEFRDDLLSFSLGEAAHDYARRLLKEQPDNAALMALFGETAWMYEKVKNSARREHWCDRLDVMQEGVDAVRRCVKLHPEYAPCHRVYTLLAVKMCDQEYWFKIAQPFGVMEHYKRIMNRGKKSNELAESADVYAALAAVNARCATNMKKWYTPYSWYAKYKGLPTREELLKTARDLHMDVYRLDPKSIENACRLGMVYWELGESQQAKRWYVRARDELKSTGKIDDMYQTMAHTHIVTQLSSHTWNVPFG